MQGATTAKDLAKITRRAFYHTDVEVQYQRKAAANKLFKDRARKHAGRVERRPSTIQTLLDKSVLDHMQRVAESGRMYASVVEGSFLLESLQSRLRTKDHTKVPAQAGAAELAVALGGDGGGKGLPTTCSAVAVQEAALLYPVAQVSPDCAQLLVDASVTVRRAQGVGVDASHHNVFFFKVMKRKPSAIKRPSAGATSGAGGHCHHRPQGNEHWQRHREGQEGGCGV